MYISVSSIRRWSSACMLCWMLLQLLAMLSHFQRFDSYHGHSFLQEAKVRAALSRWRAALSRRRAALSRVTHDSERLYNASQLPVLSGLWPIHIYVVMQVAMNTILSLTGSCVTTFLLSGYLGGGKFTMAHIQNASLAGGGSISAAAPMLFNPSYAVLIGESNHACWVRVSQTLCFWILCVYIYIHVCVDIYIYIYIYIYTHTHIYIIYIYMYIYACTDKLKYVIHAYMHTQTYTLAYAVGYMCILIHACLNTETLYPLHGIWPYTHTRARAHPHTHTHTYTYAYIPWWYIHVKKKTCCNNIHKQKIIHISRFTHTLLMKQVI